MSGTPERRGRPCWLLLAVALGIAGCQSVGPLAGRGADPSQLPAPPAGPALGVVVSAGHVTADPPPKLQSAEGTHPAGTGTAALATLTVIPPLPEQPIDLTDALRLAGIENPTIALAAEVVRASEALRMQARAMLLPTLNAGSNVRIHQGTLQGSAGVIRDVNIQSFYAGAGAGATTAGTPDISGIRIFSHLGDAYYAPQAAEQQVVARRFDSVAVRNQTLLEVGVGYLELIAARGRLAALRRSQQDLDQVVQATANFAKTGQGRDSDAQRARTEWLLMEKEAERAQEDGAVAAAELARLLNLDPSVRLQPVDELPPLLELIDPAAPLPELLRIALANHPELGARSAEVASAQIRVQQERVRPWLPVLSAGFSAGNFGGAGSQAVPTNWTNGARYDVDVAAVWSLQNLGVGNHARQNQARAEVGAAEAERLRAVNRIRADVAEARIVVVASRREIDIAQRRVATAAKAFAEDLTRTRNLVGRPIEVIRSLNLLSAARLELVRAMTGYSEAQLRLFVALGNSPGAAPPH